MTTTIASGLGATFGYSAETAYGTFVAPTHFVTFNKEQMKLKKNTVQSKALHGGLYDLATRRAYTTHTVNGAVDLDLYDRGLGLLLSQCLGSSPTPTQQATSGVYWAVHTPGDTTGKSLSLQVGRPFTSGTVQPFSYSGCKVTDWTLSVQSGQQASLSVTIDGAKEDTVPAYAAPSYVTSNMLHFAEATLLTGGTIATGSQTVGGCTVTGGLNVTGATALGVVKSAQIKGSNAMDTSRFFLGAAGQKAEPLANGFRAITGQIDVEFENLTDVYTAFAADSNTALQLNFLGPQIAAGFNSAVNILLPCVFWDDGVPTVDGPGVLHAQVNFTALDPGNGNAPIQIITTSLDSTL